MDGRGSGIVITSAEWSWGMLPLSNTRKPSDWPTATNRSTDGRTDADSRSYTTAAAGGGSFATSGNDSSLATRCLSSLFLKSRAARQFLWGTNGMNKQRRNKNESLLDHNPTKKIALHSPNIFLTITSFCLKITKLYTLVKFLGLFASPPRDNAGFRGSPSMRPHSLLIKFSPA